LFEKSVEVGDEVPVTLVVSGVKFRKLKHQQTDVLSECLAGLEEGGREQVSFQNVFVWLASPQPKSWQVGEFLNGERLFVY